MINKLKSRKLLLTVITAVIVTPFDLDEATVENLVSLVMAYVFGQGAADAAKELAKKKPVAKELAKKKPVAKVPALPAIPEDPLLHPAPAPTPKPEPALERTSPLQRLMRDK